MSLRSERIVKTGISGAQLAIAFVFFAVVGTTHNWTGLRLSVQALLYSQ